MFVRVYRRSLLAGVVVVALLGGLLALNEGRIVGDLEERGGITAFYDIPSGALTGPTGSIVKSEPLLGVPMDTRGWRIMYRSTDVNGAPVVATGVVVTPRGSAPAGGRTVASWGHPTTGSATACAPSLGTDPYLGIEGMRVLLDRGYTVVATDYTGMGAIGPQLVPDRRDRRAQRARCGARGPCDPRGRGGVRCHSVGSLAGRAGGAVRR